MKKAPLLAGTAIAALGLAGWLTLAPAQEAELLPPPTARDDMEAGRSLVERGAELFLRGLLNEIGPSLDDMQEGLSAAAKELGPKLSQLLDLVDDVKNYAAPERLPNGDILIRRAPGAPPAPPLLAPDERPTPDAPSIDL